MYFDFVVISTDRNTVSQASDLAKEYNYKLLQVSNLDELLEKYEGIKCQFAILSAAEAKHDSEVAGLVQIARQVMPDSYLFISMKKRQDANSFAFIRKSGANAIILEHELGLTGKLEFIATQKINKTHLPVKSHDFLPGTKLDYFVYHLLPLNRKYLPVLHPGMLIDDERLEKLHAVSELFVRRDDFGKYSRYMREFAGKNNSFRKARANYIDFCMSYADLAIVLTDQAEPTSFESGRKLFEKCEKAAQYLIGVLGSANDTWSLVNLSSIGDLGSVERATSTACYAGMISILSAVGDPLKAVMGAILADIGLLKLEPKILRALKSGTLELLSKDELNDYKKHPVMSLNLLSDQRISVPDDLRNIIMCSHERMDQTGFPNQVISARIPVNAQLVQLGETIDQETRLIMGQERKEFKDVILSLTSETLENVRRFDPKFLAAVRAPFIH